MSMCNRRTPQTNVYSKVKCNFVIFFFKAKKKGGTLVHLISLRCSVYFFYIIYFFSIKFVEPFSPSRVHC